jgi:hypothetical protein
MTNILTHAPPLPTQNDVIEFTDPHFFQPGDLLEISGTSINPEINGPQRVFSVHNGTGIVLVDNRWGKSGGLDLTTVLYGDRSTRSGAAARITGSKFADIRVDIIAIDINTGVFTSKQAHGMLVGQEVTVAGLQVTPDANGVHDVLTTPSTTTFTLRDKVLGGDNVFRTTHIEQGWLGTGGFSRTVGYVADIVGLQFPDADHIRVTTEEDHQLNMTRDKMVTVNGYVSISE